MLISVIGLPNTVHASDYGYDYTSKNHPCQGVFTKKIIFCKNVRTVCKFILIVWHFKYISKEEWRSNQFGG